MTDEPENHTIRLLQEMRAEMRKGFENVNLRMDGLTHILVTLASHIHQQDERIERLEAKGDDYSPLALVLPTFSTKLDRENLST